MTIFEEDDIVAEDKFNDLGEDAENADEVDIMTVAQMKELAIANARAGKEATARTLKVANEAKEIGIETAEKLHEQTEQIEHLADDFVVVHDYLDKTERTYTIFSDYYGFVYLFCSLNIERCNLFLNPQLIVMCGCLQIIGVVNKMRKPKLLRLFQRKKGRKKLEEKKLSRKEQEEKERVRQNGVSATHLERLRSSKTPAVVMSMDDIASDLSPSVGNGWNWKKDRNASAPSVVAYTDEVSKDPYADYDGDVAGVLRDQDGDLGDLSDTLAGMRDIAVAMNYELDHQNGLISKVQDYTEQTKGRTMENARKIRMIE